ncbi:DUF7536 family protein [Halorubellus salinus]|uniref:DUF7536 family protein n=1 Tax=Halorubellus salinus TaxID=755309 RepID=UPI001D06B897|nr:hypothetical protein [Halorubellus salinus]
MSDASSTSPDAEEPAASDGGTGAVDDRPERPPSARLVDALGVVDHAKRGLAVGLALAAVVFGFFVVLPLVDPGTPARAESPVLYVALAFVVATAATLLVASALAVRAVAGRVMDYAKWTRRGAIVAAIGGAWWSLTGALALAVTADVAPASVETVVLATLPLPVLALALGAWSALARVGGTGGNGTDSFDHVLARPRVANAGAVLALAGAALVHVATFLETDAFLAATAPGATSLFAVGTVVLAVGTAVLADSLARHADLGTLAAGAGTLAGIAGGLVIAATVTVTAAVAAFGALVVLGVAWLLLGVAVARDPGTYPERPV